MVLLWKRKEIINNKELNRRIECVQKARYYLETDGQVLWGGEYIYTEQELYKRVIIAIGRRHAKQLFKNIQKEKKRVSLSKEDINEILKEVK